MKFLFAFFLAIFGLALFEDGARAQTGAISERPRGIAKASAGNFQAIAAITREPGWAQKWAAAPSGSRPQFPVASVLRLGERGELLVFFSNAALLDGRVNIECDVQVFRDGMVIQPLQSGKCANYPIQGPPSDMYLTGMMIGITPEPQDVGRVTVFEIGVRDVNSGMRAPLRLSFLTVDPAAAPLSPAPLSPAPLTPAPGVIQLQ